MCHPVLLLPLIFFGQKWSMVLLPIYPAEEIVSLVSPAVPHPVLETALVQLVQPVVEEVPVLRVWLQSPSCDDEVRGMSV